VLSSKWISLIWIVAVLALVANAVVASYNVGRVLQNERVILHTRNVQSELAQILSELKDAETGQRGFLITGEDLYLRPFESARLELPQRQQLVRQLLSDNTVQKVRFERIVELVTKRIEILEENVLLVQNRQQEVAFDNIKAGHGTAIMDELRQRIKEMIDVEESLLVDRRERSRVQFQITLVTLVIGTIISLCVVGLAYFVVGQELDRRKKAEMDVRAINDQLENTVNERTNALVQTSKELLRSNQELEKFAYVASHDLQEPLRKIQAFGDRLKKSAGETLSDASRDYIDRMQASATRMRTLISDLLAYSRVSTQIQPFRIVDLSEVVAGVISDLEVRIDEYQAQIDMDPLPMIWADPIQMRQLFQNLLSNSLKFRRAEAPPRIQIHCRPLVMISPSDSSLSGKAGWQISVVDNGIGFEAQYSERIFELFQRLHGRGEYEGTGIGLSICRKIAERHGGRITAKSQPGIGTEFFIDLPDSTDSPETTKP
jgi:signal transduction histidine kinase